MLRRIAIFGAIILIVVGCSEAGDNSGYAAESTQPSRKGAAAFMSPDTGGGGMSEVSDSTIARSTSSGTGSRSQVKGATLEMRVSKLDDSEKKVLAIIKGSGGYEQSLNSSDLASSNAALSIVAKVPVAKLDDVISQIEGLGTRTAKTISMEDVTEQLMNWDTQEQALKQRKGALQGKYDNDAPYELQTVNQQIVAIDHQREVLAQRVAFSTLELKITQGAVANGERDPNWLSEAFGQSSSAALGVFRIVATAGLWLLFMSPFYVPFVVGGWFVFRARKRAKTPAQSNEVGARAAA